MNPEFVIIWLFILSVFWGYGFIVGLVYGNAVLLGIGSARDINHRITMQSPWFFFDREFKARRRRFAIGLVAFLIIWLVFTGIPTFAISGWDVPAILLPAVAMLGHTGFILAGVVWWAPRVPNFVGVAALGSLHGVGAMVVLGVLRFTFGGDWTLPYALAGMGAYFLTWHHVRRNLDHRWFRFDS